MCIIYSLFNGIYVLRCNEFASLYTFFKIWNWKPFTAVGSIVENNVLPNKIHHCRGFNFYKISEIWQAFHIIGQQQERSRAIVCRPLRGKRSAILKMKQAQREAQSLHENPMCNNFHQILSVNKKFRISGQTFTK